MFHTILLYVSYAWAFIMLGLILQRISIEDHEAVPILGAIELVYLIVMRLFLWR